MLNHSKRRMRGERTFRTMVCIIFGASAFCSICQILQLSSAPLSKKDKTKIEEELVEKRKTRAEGKEI